MPFGRQRLARLDAVLGERHLDDDVLVDGGEVAAFANHAGRVGGHDFGADRSLHGLADLLEDLAVVAALLRQQRRVGGHAVEDAERGERFDVLQVAGVDEQLHADSVRRRLLASGCTARFPPRVTDGQRSRWAAAARSSTATTA